MKKLTITSIVLLALLISIAGKSQEVIDFPKEVNLPYELSSTNPAPNRRLFSGEQPFIYFYKGRLSPVSDYRSYFSTNIANYK